MGACDMGENVRTENVRTETKTCPRCGAGVFSDMDVCYGCLYDFGGDGREAGENGHGTDENEPDEPWPDEAWGSLDELWEDGDLGLDAGLGVGEDTAPDTGGQALPVGGGPTRPAALDPSDTLVLQPVCDEVGAPWVKVCAPGFELSCAVPLAGMTLGRDAGNDLVVGARAVSRRHLTIERCRGGVAARDLGATNPALLNGRPLTGSCRLVVGDVIELRGSGVTVHPVPSPEARASAGLCAGSCG